MRLASALLVLTLLSTCMISGTFAKYTTQDSAYDEARVAKWGIELQAVGNLYGETYKDTIVADIKDDGGNTAITVQSENMSDDVVAPGTKNEEGLTFKVNGKPEVDYQATVTMKDQEIFLYPGQYGVMVKVEEGVVTEENFDEYGDLYTVDADGYHEAATYTDTEYYTLEDDVSISAGYFPVVYKLTGEGTYKTEFTSGTNDFKTLYNVVQNIGASVGNKTAEEPAGATNNNTRTVTFTSAQIDSNVSIEEALKLSNETITWEWAFGNPTAVGITATTDDKCDTILGNLMAGKNTDEIKVVRIDEEFNTNNYVDLVYGTTPGVDDHLVFMAIDTGHTIPIACLETSFDIDITVTQVD